MKSSEKSNLCLDIAKLSYSKFNDRRAYEWKVTLGLWAVILASIIKNKELPSWLWIIFVSIYAFCWLAPVWRANKQDKQMHEHFLGVAVNLLTNPYSRIGKPPGRILGLKRYFGFLFNWSVFFQLSVTSLLVVVAYFYR